MTKLLGIGVALLFGVWGAGSALANSGRWTVESRTVDGDRTIVLAHPLTGGGRLEVRALHTLRRVFGIESASGEPSSTEVILPRDPAARRTETREIIEDMTVNDGVPVSALDSFDTAYDLFEARMTAEPLPDEQAWQPGTTSAEISRYEPMMKLTYEVGRYDKRTGRVEVVVPSAQCGGYLRLVERKAPFPASDIRAAMLREVEAAIAACKLPTTSAHWMAGFDGALARAEKRFRIEFPGK